MTAFKWTARILGGGLFFVAVLWASAPARADHLDAAKMTAAGCVRYGEVLQVDPKVQAAHRQLLADLTASEEEAIFYLGFAEGYVTAASQMSRVPAIELAAKEYNYSCMLEVL